MIFGTKFRESVETITDDQLTPAEFNKGIPKHAIALWTNLVTAADDGTETGIGGTKIGFYEMAVDNDLTMQMTPGETRALFEYVYSRMGGAVPGAKTLAWDWPFYLLAMLAPTLAGGEYPEIGIPGETDKVWRVQFTSDGASAGTWKLGWKKSMREPDFTVLMIGKVLSGLTDATPDNRYEINWQPVPTVGFVISGFAHFTRIKVYVADAEGVTREVADLLHDQVLQLLDPYNVQSITDPLFIPLDQPTIFPKGSYILLTTSGYTGTERIVPIQLVPNPRAKSAKTAGQKTS